MTLGYRGNLALPLLTQSDPGSENYGVANAQTALRHRLDPTLEGTSQHKWKRKHQNVKPEIEWRKLRRRWSPGFEDKLDYGVNHDLYNPEDELEGYVSLLFSSLILRATWSDMPCRSQLGFSLGCYPVSAKGTGRVHFNP
jgi:hypothetical protein